LREPTATMPISRNGSWKNPNSPPTPTAIRKESSESPKSGSSTRKTDVAIAFCALARPKGHLKNNFGNRRRSLAPFLAANSDKNTSRLIPVVSKHSTSAQFSVKESGGNCRNSPSAALFFVAKTDELALNQNVMHSNSGTFLGHQSLANNRLMASCNSCLRIGLLI
jgi:hypothetical protein